MFQGLFRPTVNHQRRCTRRHWIKSRASASNHGIHLPAPRTHPVWGTLTKRNSHPHLTLPLSAPCMLWKPLSVYDRQPWHHSKS